MYIYVKCRRIKFNCIFQVFVIQFWCFHEIISIGLVIYRLYDLPWFRALSWYFLLSSNYFFFGESLIERWAILLRKDVSIFHFSFIYIFISFLTIYSKKFINISNKYLLTLFTSAHHFWLNFLVRWFVGQDKFCRGVSWR